jgi:hypothetical protein
LDNDDDTGIKQVVEQDDSKTDYVHENPLEVAKQKVSDNVEASELVYPLAKPETKSSGARILDMISPIEPFC